MFCPNCGTTQGEDLKFCKHCGANLVAVRQAVSTRETGEKFDWSKTWVAEMFLSGAEHERRQQELERQRGITPEVKRYNEIKAGVITSCVGVGVMIFLYVFMQGLILGGNLTPAAAEIISRLWVAGVIPFFVGVGLLINGLFVSKRLVETARQEMRAKETPKALELTGRSQKDASLSSVDWSEGGSPRFSVTEHTTRQLDNSVQEE